MNWGSENPAPNSIPFLKALSTMFSTTSTTYAIGFASGAVYWITWVNMRRSLNRSLRASCWERVFRATSVAGSTSDLQFHYSDVLVYFQLADGNIIYMKMPGKTKKIDSRLCCDNTVAQSSIYSWQRHKIDHRSREQARDMTNIHWGVLSAGLEQEKLNWSTRTIWLPISLDQQ